MSTTEQHWDSFYAENGARWSGKPNASLVEQLAGLAPGRALDLGCGQGGDAIWLASQGWEVTGVDVSGTALAAAEQAAADAGLADTITWVRADLADELPSGPYELVVSSFLHSPVELPRSEILRRAARTVAPGGMLLTIGHAPSPEHPHHDLPGLDEVVAEPGLADEEWELVTRELISREHAFRGEETHARVDSVVRWRRR